MVKYLDNKGQIIFPTYEQIVEDGTRIKIAETKQNFNDYELYKTIPENKEEIIVTGEITNNTIEHYYYNKETHTQIKYHSNGGNFGNGNKYDVTNSEKTERIVIAKLGGLLKPYNPADIYIGVDITSKVGH